VVENEGHGSKAPSIGRPIANTQVYVLDKGLQPVPVGDEGELYIGGDGLARGYLRRPELTAERFIANPFSSKPGARLYKTGDLVRYTAAGMIEFVGRNDDQVKIRGYRIELGEIETVLAGHPGVRAVVVLAREENTGEKRLAAYVVLQEPAPGEGELREYLKQRLPDYMVPAVFVALERLPLTSHGKIDRTALPMPDAANTMRDEAGADSLNDIEKTVAGLLASLLKVDKVDAQANFFDLGGHSLLGTQIIARIRDAFGVDLPLRKIFESPTVAELSAEIEHVLVAELEAGEKK
jgi:acyl carrier protein